MLRAIMGISARSLSLADRPYWSELRPVMQSNDNIVRRRHERAAGRYVRLWPFVQPSERGWIKATKRILEDYPRDNIFMIIDTDGSTPVMTKAGFDEMIKHLHDRGLNRATVDDAFARRHSSAAYS